LTSFGVFFTRKSKKKKLISRQFGGNKLTEIISYCPRSAGICPKLPGSHL